MTKLTRALCVATLFATMGLVTFAAEDESAAQGAAGSAGRPSEPSPEGDSNEDDSSCAFGSRLGAGSGMGGLALGLAWALAARRRRT